MQNVTALSSLVSTIQYQLGMLQDSFGRLRDLLDVEKPAGRPRKQAAAAAKRTISAAGRKRIAAAARKRWATVKAKQTAVGKKRTVKKAVVASS
jgi:hypothetical protein